KLEAGSQKLEAVRKSVLSLRRKKSMVIDPADPNSKSVGSFFKNPILSKIEFAAFADRCEEMNISGNIPTFPAGNAVKIPAAWLVENAGFKKGYRKGGAGVSANHTLALVNHGGTTKELLALAEEIQSTVAQRFGVRLEREPIIVQSN
ncbi:MAG: UDP-N-acetylenolpyruvoylglucosamine reductase, partial [Bacteroidota bacterium]